MGLLLTSSSANSINAMKLLSTILSSIVLVSASASAQIVFTESFDYTVGTELSAANSAWGQANANADVISIASGSLSVPGLLPSSGNHIAFDGGGTDYQRTFTPVETGSLWYSFAFQVTDATANTTAGYFAGFGQNATNFSTTIWTQQDGAGFNLGVVNNTSTANIQFVPGTLSLNTTYFVVGSFNLDDDTASLWFAPSSATFGQVDAPAATISGLTGTARSSLDRFFIRQDSTSETAFMLMDEIRVGTTWASVTPVPEPATYAAILGIVVLGLAIVRRRK